MILNLMSNKRPEMFFFSLFSLVDTEYCNNIIDLHDRSGNFLRTVCVVENFALHVEADSRCQIYGMQLYNVDTDEVEKALLDYINTHYSKSNNISFHIDDVKMNSTKCVAVTKSGNVTKLKNISCRLSCYFFCQYNVSPKTKLVGKTFFL
jgi:hypothetical protein